MEEVERELRIRLKMAIRALEHLKYGVFQSPEQVDLVIDNALDEIRGVIKEKNQEE